MAEKGKRSRYVGGHVGPLAYLFYFLAFISHLSSYSGKKPLPSMLVMEVLEP
jgi:hypothetical protein